MSLRCGGCNDGSELEFAIRTAFQPIMDFDTGRPFAYEALVRGADGEGAAEVLSRVSPSNRYAFDQACRVTAIRARYRQGCLRLTPGCRSISCRDAVYSPLACIQLTLKTARETGLPTDRLIFEFTESEQIDVDHAKSIIAAYKALGFATAIDDFGAGHAGLSLLANLQTDLIKIDMELIRGIDASVPRRQIVESIRRLSSEMGLTVIAEGIETAAELAVLRSIGIRFVQGFVFGRPALGKLPRAIMELDTALAA